MSPMEAAFPSLTGSGFQTTSPADLHYNCIAWAAGISDRWWWPDASFTAFWPAEAPRIESLPAFIAAFGTLGFLRTETGPSEAGRDSIAIYCRDSLPTHAARRLPSGRWTSKLGAGPDIEHELNDLTGDVYGQVAAILERHLVR